MRQGCVGEHNEAFSNMHMYTIRKEQAYIAWPRSRARGIAEKHGALQQEAGLCDVRTCVVQECRRLGSSKGRTY